MRNEHDAAYAAALAARPDRPQITEYGRVLPAGTPYISPLDGTEHTATAPYLAGWQFKITGKAVRPWTVNELAQIAIDHGTAQPGDHLCTGEPTGTP